MGVAADAGWLGRHPGRGQIALAAVASGATLAAVAGANRRALVLSHGEGLLRGLGSVAKLVMEAFGDLQAYREQATADLRSYDAPAWRTGTACEAAGRILALSMTPLTCAEILDKIDYDDRAGWPRTISGLNDLLQAHPAFPDAPGGPLATRRTRERLTPHARSRRQVLRSA